jgi:chromosome segregation ATPase
MGRNAAVTYEQVAAEAEQLQAEGVTATAKLIRSRLGNVGSLATIQKHVTAWRSKLDGTQPVTRMLPPEVQRAVFKYVDEEIGRINGELTKQVAQANADMADLAADNEKQTGLICQLQAALEEQVTLTAERAGQMSRLLDELRAAREETARERREAELARQELARIQSRFEAQAPLESQLRQLRTDFESERDGRVRAQQDAAVLKAQKDILEARVAELKAALPSQGSTYGGTGKEHASGKPARSSRTSTRIGKDVGGSAEASSPGCPPSPAVEAANGAGDPRQASLC